MPKLGSAYGDGVRLISSSPPVYGDGVANILSNELQRLFKGDDWSSSQQEASGDNSPSVNVEVDVKTNFHCHLHHPLNSSRIRNTFSFVT